LRLDEWRSQSQPLRISRHPVAFLDGVAAAERCPTAAMNQLPADIEILVDDEYRRPEIAGPNGSMQPDASRSEDHDVNIIVPLNGLRVRFARRQNCGANAGGCTALEERAPAQRLLLLKLCFFPAAIALF
jgi:hypothetical protein